MNKGNVFTTVFLILSAIVLFVIYSSVYVVQEGTVAIKLRFNKIIRDSDGTVVIYNPGLHFKIPLTDSYKILDSRIRTFDGQSDRFITVEKKDVLVDSYVKWKIVDFGNFYTSTGGDYLRADELLHRKVNDRLRSEIGNKTIKDIVSGSRGELMSEARRILNSGQDSASSFGIEIIDVRIKQINLPDEVSNSIYQRMRAERSAVASGHRSQGKEKAAFIMSETDRKITILLAEAEKQAQILRGQGDAEANKIYNGAFSKSPEFFNFYRSLEAYQLSFNNNNSVMVIKPDQEGFYKYLFNKNSK